MIDSGMHPWEKREKLAIGGLMLLLIPLYFWLLSAGTGIYASPDETANAVTIRQLNWYGRISVAEPLANEFPWVHPRSYVTKGEGIAPVGFLGWPWIISVFSFILGQGMVPVLATLAALSCAIPLYGLLRRFGPASAFAGVLVTMTFPTMILFGNRSLFPQVGLMVFALWSMYLVSITSSKSAPWNFAGLSALACLALASRPTEVVWVLPWLLWAARPLRPDRTRILASVIGALIPLGILAGYAQMTYGGFWMSGYMVEGNDAPAMISLPASPQDSSRSLLFPFGIHPMYVAWNAWSFLGRLLAPWSVLALVAFGFACADIWRGRIGKWKNWLRENAVVGLVAWTAVFLVAYYGQGMYTDHVQRGAVTIANSFVRYLLPLAALAGLATAFLHARFQKSPRLVLGFSLVVVLLSGYGSYVALARDNEGLIATRAELGRYHEIRRKTAKFFGPQDLILSERSDKIFFPGHRASSIPAVDEAARLVRAYPHIRLGLFARPLSQPQADAWRKAGFEPTELLVSGREKLYHLAPIRR